MTIILAISLVFAVFAAGERSVKQPNLIFFVADDLGWNDVGYHNPEMRTPNIDQAAKEGVILSKNYVQQLCTPSRSAFMTGYYPHRNGLNLLVIPWFAPYGLPTQFKLLPEYLKDLGYSTHMIGKWHLGSCSPDYLPHNRGFDTAFGFMSAATYYYNHSYPLTPNTIMIAEPGVPDVYDLFNKSIPATQYNGTYTLETMMVELKIILENRDENKPQFYYIAMPSVHSPIEYPKENEYWYPKVQNKYRKGFCSFATEMDTYFGQIMNMFKVYGIYDNSVLFFTTDNGGETKSGGNNYPLRGSKFTLYEGGTRGVAFVHSPLLQHKGYVHKKFIQAVDYPATIISLAGGTPDPNMDGVNAWPSINYKWPSTRNEFVYELNVNLNDSSKYDGAYRYGPWKLIFGDPRLPNRRIKPENVTGELYNACGGYITYDINAPPFQLYNIDDDPTESNDLATCRPDLVKKIYKKVEKQIKRMVVSLYMPQNIELYKSRTTDLAILNRNWCTPITHVTPMFPESTH